MPDPKPSFTSTLISDTSEAGTRVVAEQSLKATRKFLVALATRGFGKKEGARIAERITSNLESPVGEVLLAYVCGGALMFLPEKWNTPRAQALAKELRVRALAQAGNGLANLLSDPALDVILDYLTGEDAPASTPAALEAESQAREEFQRKTNDIVDEVLEPAQAERRR